MTNLRSLALDVLEIVLPPLAPLKHLEVLSISGECLPGGQLCSTQEQGGMQGHVSL